MTRTENDTSLVLMPNHFTVSVRATVEAMLAVEAETQGKAEQLATDFFLNGMTNDRQVWMDDFNVTEGPDVLEVDPHPPVED